MFVSTEERRDAAGRGGGVNRPGLVDGRDARVNIATYLGRRATHPPLKMISRPASAS